VLVEWRSGATVPIEIELVAWGGPMAAGAAAAEYLTPPFMKSSPVYARVVRTASPTLIFTGGCGAVPGAEELAAGAAAAAAAEVTAAFAQLQRLMDASGSDLRHLVKATYYVAGEPVSLGLNQWRPRYYDPERPPAASKALVPGVGFAGRTLTMDMIAVPVPKLR
jgi:enamine deaminase RidA (YjgF/YER057c/UK114 family)